MTHQSLSKPILDDYDAGQIRCSVCGKALKPNDKVLYIGKGSWRHLRHKTVKREGK